MGQMTGSWRRRPGPPKLARNASTKALTFGPGGGRMAPAWGGGGWHHFGAICDRSAGGQSRPLCAGLRLMGAMRATEAPLLTR